MSNRRSLLVAQGTILVTGASGFVGSHLANYAVGRGRSVECIVRRTSDTSALDLGRLRVIEADLLDASSLEAAFSSPVHTVVHCAATTSETRVDYAQSFKVNVDGTRHILQLSEAAGVERFIMVSTQSAHPRNPSTYGRTKLAADELVRKAPLAYTILKPSTIYGPGTKGLFAKMVRLLDKLPIVPVLGSGQRLIRPIHVHDLCDAILACEMADVTINKTYDLGGSDLVTYDEFLRYILQARGKKKPLVHLPLPVCRCLAAAFSFMKHPPFTRDNLLGLTQNDVCNISHAQSDFKFSPRGLREGLFQTAIRNRAVEGKELRQ
jgi:nucleoside-diphosphate-sugar epimerase